MDTQTVYRILILLCLNLSISCNLVLSQGTTCSRLCHYVPRARDADCSRRNLRQIPLQCSGSKLLNLNNNNITSIHGGAFRIFKYLKYLQISGSSVHELNANSFAGARNLKAVNLLQNELSEIPMHSFNYTESLRWLYLSKNRIRRIDQDVFQESPQIEMLYLDDNQFSSLRGDEFRQLSMMQRLLLGGNMLRTLPDNIFTDLISLDYIDLSRNLLRKLSPDLFSGLPNLKTVKLAGNRLVDIMPGTFSSNMVMSLDISDNKLVTIQWDLFNFAEVNEIEATGNPWFCNCSLDSFRSAMVKVMSSGVGPSVTCRGPESIANTDITSHSTFCLSSSAKPTENAITVSVKSARGNNLERSYQKSVGKEGSGLSNQKIIEKEDTVNYHTPALITLIAVSVITGLACVILMSFCMAICIINRRRKSGNIKTNIDETTLEDKPSKLHPPDSV